MQNARNTRRRIWFLLAMILLASAAVLLVLGPRAALAIPNSYTVTDLDLGSLPANNGVKATKINASGDVIGFYYDTDYQAQAFLYQNGQFEELIMPSSITGTALDLNSSGDVVGFYAGANGSRAFLYEDGVMHDLNDLVPSGSGNTLTLAVDITDSGRVIGYYRDAANARHVFVYQNGQMQDLNAIPGGQSGDVTVVNDATQMAGTTFDGNFSRAFLYSDGQTTDLGAPTGTSSYANDLNDSGQVAGYYYDGADDTSYPFLYDGQLEVLDGLGGREKEALGINNSGQAVGYADNADGSYRGATLWENGQVIDLNTLIPGDSGVTLTEAADINDSGVIAANGYSAGFADRVLLLTPSNEPPDRDRDGVPDTSDICPNDAGPEPDGCPPPPENDGFAGAQNVAGDETSVAGYNFLATRETGEPDHLPDDSSSSGEQSVWYSWTPQASRSVTMDTCQSAFNTVLAVYEGEDLNGLTRIAGADGGCASGNGSKVAFDAQAGSTYMIAVSSHGLDSNNGAQTGNFTLRVYRTPQADVSVGATDTPDPVVLGQNVTYTLTARNDGPDPAEGVEGSLSFESADATVISTPSGCVTITSGTTKTISCPSSNTVPNGGQKQWQIVLKPAQAGTLTVQAHAGSTNTSDPDPSDQNLEVQTTVEPPPPNQVPVAVNDSAITNEDTQATGNVLTNDTDADGDALTVALPRPASGPAHGTLTLNANGSFAYTPDANYNGSDSFTYKATDGTDDSNTATVSITVNPVNDKPVAQNQAVQTDEDTPKDVTLSATDIENGALTYNITSGPQHGTVSGTGSGRTYTPAANYHGTDSFTYRASDGSANSDPATVTITVNAINDAPAASNDTASTSSGIGVNINVRGNDSDADGDALTVSAVSTPGHGTTTINPDGTVRYVPVAGYVGPDSFTYTVSDGNGGTDTATVSVTVRDTAAPVISGMSPKPGSKIKDTTPTIKATITDAPAGLQASNIKLYVNGKAISASKFTYNTATGGLVYNSSRLPKGKRTVKIVATDAAGNTTTKSWSFTIK